MNTSPELAQAVTTLADSIRPLLQEIHDTPPTTRNYYGDYMAILAGTDSQQRRYLFALAMIEAGANVEGIRDAMNLLG